MPRAARPEISSPGPGSPSEPVSGSGLLDCVALILSLAAERGVDVHDWFADDMDGEVVSGAVMPAPQFTTLLSSLAFGVTVNESSKTVLEIERGLSDGAIKAVIQACGNVEGTDIDVSKFIQMCNERIEGGFLPSGTAARGGVATPIPSPKAAEGRSSGGGFIKLSASPFDEEVQFDIDELLAEHGVKLQPQSSVPSTRKLLSSRLGISINGSGKGRLENSRPRSSSSTSAAAAAAASALAPHQVAAAPSSVNALLQSARDVVEDLLRGIVRQPNQYFRLQAHLGWREASQQRAVSRVALPPPTGWADQWLSVDELQHALLEGPKVRFSDAQIGETLFALVAAFAQSPAAKAQHQASLRRAAARDQALTASGAHTALHSATAVGPLAAKKSSARQRRALKVHHRGRLSAQWLREYLEHLRLHDRSSSDLSDKQRLAATGEPGAADPFQSAALDTSLATASAGPVSAGAPNGNGSGNGSGNLPTELRRALSGRPHGLTKPEELRALVRKHPLLSEAQLAREVAHRVHCWREDHCGTHGFARALRLAAMQWARDQSAEGLVSGSGASHSKSQSQSLSLSAVWASLPDFSRAETAAALEAQVLRVRHEELLSAERVGQSISLELFRRYDDFCRDSNYAETCAWAEWLAWWQGDKAIKDAARDVRQLQRDAAARLLSSLDKVARRPAHAHFAFVEPAATAPPSPAKAARAERMSLRASAASASASASSSSSSFVPPPKSAPASASVGSRSSSSSRKRGNGKSGAKAATHGAVLRDTLAAARSALMTAGLGKDSGLFPPGELGLLAALDVGLPPDSPRPAAAAKRRLQQEQQDKQQAQAEEQMKAEQQGRVARAASAPSPALRRGSEPKVSSSSNNNNNNSNNNSNNNGSGGGKDTALRRWASKKLTLQRKQKKEEERQQAEKQAAEEAKAREARKHFRQWLRLRAQGKYGPDARALPQPQRVAHEAQWVTYGKPAPSASTAAAAAAAAAADKERAGEAGGPGPKVGSPKALAAALGRMSSASAALAAGSEGGEDGEASMSLLSL